MIEADELALAQSYEQLETSAAFQNLVQWLEEDLEQAEKRAETSTPDEKTATVRAKFIAWQQRKQVMTLIHGKIKAAKQYAQDAREILDNERRTESERASRGNW